MMNEDVILLHGLGRSSRSLLLMQTALERAGYTVHNASYPSRDFRIEELVVRTVPARFAACSGKKVHFVTHSMGGILVRAWLAETQPERLGRIVMLAPPNKGTAVVDAFEGLKAFGWFTGKAGLQLGTTKDSLPFALPGMTAETGIIAGSSSWNPIGHAVLTEAHDGTVSVESTKVEGMKDHIILPVGHSFMMNNPLVMAQVMAFLQRGHFDRGLTLPEAIKRIAGL
ncbi:MAG: alpha/beta fold hydrolase [Pseudomonadota bacterium]